MKLIDLCYVILGKIYLSSLTVARGLYLERNKRYAIFIITSKYIHAKKSQKPCERKFFCLHGLTQFSWKPHIYVLPNSDSKKIATYCIIRIRVFLRKPEIFKKFLNLPKFYLWGRSTLTPILIRC